MTKVVWKYPLEIVDRQEVDVPAGSTPLSVVLQYGQPVLYVLADPYEPNISVRKILISGTGVNRMGLEAEKFLGTVVLAGGNLVFHAFDGGVIR